MILFIQGVLYRPPSASPIKRYNKHDELYILSRDCHIPYETIQEMPVSTKSELMHRATIDRENSNNFRRDLIKTIVDATKAIIKSRSI